MDARDLRLQILTVLGLPIAGVLSASCKKTSVESVDASEAIRAAEGLPPARSAPTHVAPPLRPSVRAAAEQAMAAALGPAPSALPPCVRDQLPETLCGFVAAPTKPAPSPLQGCAATGDELEASGVMTFGETIASKVLSKGAAWKANEPANATYKLDPLRSRTYRISVAGTLAVIEAEQPDQVRAQYTARRPERACCYSRCTTLEVSSATRTEKHAGWAVGSVCIDAPPGGTSLPAPGDPACPVGIKLGTGPSGDVAPKIGASPTIDGSGRAQCCYAPLVPLPDCNEVGVGDGQECTGVRRQNARGRPIREGGVAIVAEARRSGSWLDGDAPPWDAAGDLPPSTREALAAAWTRDAAMEHASVASFGRLGLELLALGAPADLVDAVHVAARDEIRHARVAYGLASRFAGEPRGPARLAVTPGPVALDLVTVARDTFLDGCVGESVAALEAREAHDSAEEPSLREVLKEIATDEASHAALAWRVVAWAVAEGGAPVTLAIAELVAAIERELLEPVPAMSDVVEDPRLASWGVLPERERHATRRRALVDVVLPCAAALESTWTPSARVGGW